MFRVYYWKWPNMTVYWPKDGDFPVPYVELPEDIMCWSVKIGSDKGSFKDWMWLVCWGFVTSHRDNLITINITNQSVSGETWGLRAMMQHPFTHLHIDPGLVDMVKTNRNSYLNQRTKMLQSWVRSTETESVKSRETAIIGSAINRN